MYLRNFFQNNTKRPVHTYQEKWAQEKWAKRGHSSRYNTHAFYVCTGLTFYIGKITLNIYKKDSMSPTEKYFIEKKISVVLFNL